MKKSIIILVLAAVAAAVALVPRPITQASQQPAAPPPDDVLFACQGRIEGSSDTIEVSASIDGVIDSLAVKEGQHVRKGQRLATLGCQDTHANVETQRAQLESAKQALVRLRRGYRDEERHAAAESTREAKAVRDHAKASFDRLASLFKTEDISRQMLDSAQRDLDVAEASYRKAQEQEHLITAPPLAEDLARLEADVAAAEARLRSSEASFGKCSVEAPVTGTVIRLLRRPGESVSTFTPQPILTIADLSSQRVRAEVDERDVTKIFVGQSAAIHIEGQPDVGGHVARSALHMGRKNIQAILPGDKNDRDVLDVWIDLPKTRKPLPLGLRVLVQFARKD